MFRDYHTGSSNEVKIFSGIEVEHTQMHGQKTLFVVGTEHSVDTIVDYCKKYDCSHVYLGANMSFDINQLDNFSDLAWALLEKDFWVTLDFDVMYVQDVTECKCVEHDRFIPMISVKVPYADLLGYNACIKIDDKDFRASNNGVWTHRLRGLMDNKVFTPWSSYTKDTVIE